MLSVITDNISSWKHSGFSVYCAKRIYPHDSRSTENLARYIIRASFSQKRMEYFPDKEMVTYQSKYGKKVAEFNPCQWMAALTSHIPDKGEQTVRYCRYYSNVTRGRLRKENDKRQYHIIEDDFPTGLNKSWARLIQKIY
ncbi:MAG: transposase, partial [Actinomycetota bacterium]